MSGLRSCAAAAKVHDADSDALADGVTNQFYAARPGIVFPVFSYIECIEEEPHYMQIASATVAGN